MLTLHLKNLPIKSKLLLTNISISFFTLTLAFASLIIYDIVVFREEARREICTMADLIGTTCAAALIFDDSVDGGEILSALKTEQSIVSASIYDSAGASFATYVRNDVQMKAPSEIKKDGCYFEDGRLSCFRSIMFEDFFLGTIFIQTDLNHMYSILYKRLGIIAAVILISFLVALVLSAKLQRIVTGPLLRLADLARMISKGGDYSLRAIREAKDEVGDLVDAFNDMLEQIEQQNESLGISQQHAVASAEKAHQLAEQMEQINFRLTEYQRNLEQMVETRTAQLTMANKQLTIKIAEREEAESKIQAALLEKNTLLAEIHHRVRNNLQVISSLLSLSHRRTLSAEARFVLEDARSRIFTMALIHSQLYRSNDFNRVNMRRHIYKLWESTQQNFNYLKRKVVPVIDCRDVYLTVTQGIPCALVLNEAITNVFKHAYKDSNRGTCYITMKQSQNRRIMVRIKDEGSGIPETIDVEKTETLGIKLMRNLGRQQLKGKFSIERNNGTDIRMEFDLADEEPMMPIKQ